MARKTTPLWGLLYMHSRVYLCYYRNDHIGRLKRKTDIFIWSSRGVIHWSFIWDWAYLNPWDLMTSPWRQKNSEWEKTTENWALKKSLFTFYVEEQKQQEIEYNLPRWVKYSRWKPVNGFVKAQETECFRKKVKWMIGSERFSVLLYIKFSE